MGYVRSTRQREALEWAERCFAQEEIESIPHRGIRFVEEAIELAQACKVSKAVVHDLVEHIYAQPAGEIRQELGGVGLTLLILGSALAVDVDLCEQRELERVQSKDPRHFTERNAAKNAKGFKHAVRMDDPAQEQDSGPQA